MDHTGVKAAVFEWRYRHIFSGIAEAGASGINLKSEVIGNGPFKG
jgi:hypothetical protein